MLILIGKKTWSDAPVKNSYVATENMLSVPTITIIIIACTQNNGRASISMLLSTIITEENEEVSSRSEEKWRWFSFWVVQLRSSSLLLLSLLLVSSQVFTLCIINPFIFIYGVLSFSYKFRGRSACLRLSVLGRATKNNAAAILRRYSTSATTILLQTYWCRSNQCKHSSWRRTFFQICSLLHRIQQFTHSVYCFYKNAGWMLHLDNTDVWENV